MRNKFKILIVILCIISFLSMNIIFARQIGFMLWGFKGFDKLSLIYFELYYETTEDFTKDVNNWLRISDIYLKFKNYEKAERILKKYEKYDFGSKSDNINYSLSYLDIYIYMDNYEKFVDVYYSQVDKNLDGFDYFVANRIICAPDLIARSKDKIQFIEFGFELLNKFDLKYGDEYSDLIENSKKVLTEIKEMQ